MNGSLSYIPHRKVSFNLSPNTGLQTTPSLEVANNTPPSNNNSLTLNCWSSIDLNLSNGNNLNGTEADQVKTQSEPDLCPKPTCRETRPCSDQECPCREGCRSQICPFFQIAKLPICRIISNSGNFLNSNLPRHSLTLETSVSTIGPSST